MDYNKIEDSVFKKAMEVFKEGASEFFNLGVTIDKPAETEIKNIDIKTNAMDYLFYLTNGDYLHFEFQTTKKKEDMGRFLYYDASLYYKSRKPIRTVVVYSSDILEATSQLECGSIHYSVESFYMKNLNGDEKLKNLKHKVENNLELTEQDIMNLSFIPLMSTTKPQSEIIVDSLELASKIKEENSKNKCITLLYALFDKFGDEKSKRKFKEVISMTEVGKMIYEEGIEKGVDKAKDIFVKSVVKALTKKLGMLPVELQNSILALTVDQIEKLTENVTDIESIEDLKKYI